MGKVASSLNIGIRMGNGGIIMDQQTYLRLKEKNVDTRLLNELREGYGYPPSIAKSIVDTVREVLGQPISEVNGAGKMEYLAAQISDGASKKIQDMRLKPVMLTLHADDDIEVLNAHGIAGLRKVKIQRLAQESYEQGALLTQEDLAVLLCSSVRTIRYDLKELRSQDIEVRTRGQVKGIGLRVSHKAKIIQLYLDGLEYTDLERRTKHSGESIKNYIQTFKRILILRDKHVPVDEISTVVSISTMLVEEYLRLIDRYESQGSSRLKALREPPVPKAVKGGSR